MQSFSAKFGLSRKAYFHAKFGFRFHFTTDFPENVISAQSLTTKFGSVFNFPAKFFGNNFSKFLSEK